MYRQKQISGHWICLLRCDIGFRGLVFLYRPFFILISFNSVCLYICTEHGRTSIITEHTDKCGGMCEKSYMHTRFGIRYLFQHCLLLILFLERCTSKASNILLNLPFKQYIAWLYLKKGAKQKAQFSFLKRPFFRGNFVSYHATVLF